MNQVLMSPDQEFAPRLETGAEIHLAPAEQSVWQSEQPTNHQPVAQPEAMLNRPPAMAETHFHGPTQEIVASRHRYMERYALAQSFRLPGVLGAIRKAVVSLRAESLVARQHRGIKAQEAAIGGQIIAEYARDGRDHIFYVDYDNTGYLAVWNNSETTVLYRVLDGQLKKWDGNQPEYRPVARAEEHSLYNILAHYRLQVSELHR